MSTERKPSRMFTYSIPSPKVLREEELKRIYVSNHTTTQWNGLTEEELLALYRHYEPVLKTKIKPEYTAQDLYDMYYKGIFKAAYAKTKNLENAEDLVQTIYLRMLNYFDSIDHRNISTCVSQHCYFAHVDWFRNIYREGGDPSLFDSLNDPDFIFKDPISQEADPFLNYLRDNSSLCFINKLTMLSPMDAKVFALFYLEGYSATEISEEMKISLDGVYGRLKRTRRSIAECYDSTSIRDLV